MLYFAECHYAVFCGVSFCCILVNVILQCLCPLSFVSLFRFSWHHRLKRLCVLIGHPKKIIIKTLGQCMIRLPSIDVLFKVLYKYELWLLFLFLRFRDIVSRQFNFSIVKIVFHEILVFKLNSIS
jgi:hypothetical protein